MSETPFDPSLDLLLIRAWIWGPRGRKVCRLALDTGSSDTLITPEILDFLGYNPRDAEAVTTVTSVLGAEKGYRIRVARLRTLGFEFADFLVHAHDLPDDCGIDGLLGLNFLRQFNYEVRSKEGVIRLELA